MNENPSSIHEAIRIADSRYFDTRALFSTNR